MLEQDYKLLAYIQSQPRKRLNKIQALSFSSSVPANRARIDELKEKKYIRETTYYIDILPKGEKALEDYLLEQNRQQPQSHHKSVFTKENIMFVFKLLSCVFAIAAAIKELLF